MAAAAVTAPVSIVILVSLLMTVSVPSKPVADFLNCGKAAR